MSNYDFDITVDESKPENHSQLQLPLNFLSFGQVESDDVRVYIKQNVYQKLERYAASNTDKELGSILLGDYVLEHGKYHVVISDYIEAKFTDASASTLTFTHETWDYVHKEHEKRYPDLKIIGWQHTHPTYGIFLSNYDMFIQENFFNLPFQIAYVIDPVQNLRGFFQWKNDKVEKLQGYYIYDDVGTPIKISQTKVSKEEPAQPVKKSKVIPALVALLCVAVVILSFFTFSLYQKLQQQVQSQQVLLESLGGQNLAIENQSDIVNELNYYFSQGMLNKDGTILVSDLITMLENHDATLADHTALLEQLKSLLTSDEYEDADKIYFISYTVKAGDSLAAVCRAHGVDYRTYKKLILHINNIADPDRIYVGQLLLLPVVS